MGNENNYYLVPGSELTDIGAAIREKVETTTEYAVEEMADAIREISTEVAPTLEERSVDPTLETVEVTPNTGYDGLSKVTVNPIALGNISSPDILIDGSGKITASVDVDAGWVVSAPTAGTKQLETVGATTITPTKAAQTAVANNVYTTGEIKVAPIPDEYVIPSGTTTITANGIYDVKSYASADVQITGEAPVLQAKTVDPAVSSQTVTPDSDYDGLSSVTVNAMPSGELNNPTASVENGKLVTKTTVKTSGYLVQGTEVSSDIADVKTSNNLMVNGGTVTAPAGYYPSDASRTLESGTCTVSGGGLTKGNGSVSAESDVLGSASNTQPTTGYYIKATGSGSVSRDDIKEAHNKGYIEDKQATTVISGTSLDSNTATLYYPINTQTKSITPDFYDDNNSIALDSITVSPDDNNLLSSVTIERDSDLVPENIKEGIEIFGVVGTCQEGVITGSESTNLQSSLEAIKSHIYTLDTTFVKTDFIWLDTSNWTGSGSHYVMVYYTTPSGTFNITARGTGYASNYIEVARGSLIFVQKSVNAGTMSVTSIDDLTYRAQGNIWYGYSNGSDLHITIRD